MAWVRIFREERQPVGSLVKGRPCGTMRSREADSGPVVQLQNAG